MAWKVEKSADGLPVWSGQDSIFNSGKEFAIKGHGGPSEIATGVAVMLGLPLALVAFSIAAHEVGIIVLLASVSIAVVGFVTSEKKYLQKDFVGARWTLAAKASELTFSSDDSIAWAILLDQVARVETSQTIEWQTTRDWGGRQLETSPHEWQVFLFLTDSTRRPIYHSNADRDGCAALAASIRQHVESARSTSAPVTGSDPAAPIAGFDL